MGILDFADGSTWVIPEGYLYLGDHPSQCRSCKAPILWVETKNAKRAPLNPDGVNHFATCPQSSSWRKR